MFTDTAGAVDVVLTAIVKISGMLPLMLVSTGKKLEKSNVCRPDAGEENAYTTSPPLK